MPSAHGQKHTMERQKSASGVASAQSGGESCSFICTICGDGFGKYNEVVTHMAVHGPLESFSFDGSSNGFEVPREYVLHENGTLTVVNGPRPSFAHVRPASPGVLPSPLPLPVKQLALRPPPTPSRDEFRPRTSGLTLDKSRQGTYSCEKCCRCFTSMQSLNLHQQYRNIGHGYKCTLCCKTFTGIHELKTHLQDHTNDRFHCCDQCGKRFLSVESLHTHQKEIHAPVSVAAGNLENRHEKIEKSYPCKKCKLMFFWMSDFQTHSLYHCQGKEQHPTFPSKIGLEVAPKALEDRQLQNCHSNDIGIENSERKILEETGGKIDKENSFTPYRCGLCGESFQKLTALKEHHLTHQSQEEIDQLNEESQKIFKRKLLPQRSRRKGSNPNGKLHPCKHCHRVFNHSSSLSRHMRYHKGTMHTCSFCGRRFPQRCDMRRHVLMYHKAELDKKPGLKHLYMSQQNGPTISSLNGEENPRSPDENAKSFSENEQNASSEHTPNENKSIIPRRTNYSCLECGKKFGLLCVYQRHLRYHKKAPNRCPKCPAQFRNFSSLELHLRNHPSSEEVGGVDHASHDSGTNGCPVLEESNEDMEDLEDVEDMENDFMDHTQMDERKSSEVLYDCTECTETFTCLETFLQHQTSHGSEKDG